LFCLSVVAAYVDAKCYLSFCVLGRVKAIHTSGAKLVFYDLYDNDDFKVQIMANARYITLLF